MSQDNIEGAIDVTTERNSMRVGIIGGGITGLSLAYYLTRAGAQVQVFEAAATPGGLAGSTTLPDGTAVDRYYHTILPSDANVLQLCQELNLSARLRFHQTRMGFYHEGRVHSMNNVIEFLRFPPLTWVDRFRLGLTVLYAQLQRDWRRVERISVEQWLVGLSGRHVYETIWRPMLKAKFDGAFDDTPATYIWSRLVRMKSTRKGVEQKEAAGHLIGGYATLTQALAAYVQQTGGKVHCNAPVDEIMVDDGKATGVRVAGEKIALDRVVCTTPAPVLAQMLPESCSAYHNALLQTEYLGLICPLMVLDEPLSGYWTLYLTDESTPFTGIIETTTYIDPQYVGGHHLVYLPKYIAPGSAWANKSDDEIREQWLHELEKMFPRFDRRQVRAFEIGRETHVEPLHRLNASHLIPTIATPVNDMYLVNTAQIYPALTNCESIIEHAQQAARTIAQ